MMISGDIIGHQCVNIVEVFEYHGSVELATYITAPKLIALT